MSYREDLKIEAGGGLTFSDGGALQTGNDIITFGTATSGSLPNLGANKNIITLLVADFGDATLDKLLLGHSTSNGASHATLMDVTITSDDNVNTADAITASTPSLNSQAILMWSDTTANTFSVLEVNATTIVNVGTPVTPIKAVLDMDFRGGSISMDAGVKLFGALTFEMLNQPNETYLTSLAAWCNANWRANNKILPPMLAGII